MKTRQPIRWFGLSILAQALCLFLASLACANEVTFRPVLKDITAGDIQIIAQDSLGFIWIGGRHALLRYNGHEFQEIFIAGGEGGSGEPTSLRTVTGIVEDKAGNLWVSSYQGLFLLDPHAERFNKVRPQNGADEPLYSHSIFALSALPSGDLLLGTQSGIAIMQSQSHQLEAIDLSERFKGFENNTINAMIVQDEQTVWLGARTGLFLFNPVTRALSHFLPSPGNPGSQVDNAISSLELATDGTLWCGTSGAGLFVFDPKAQTFTLAYSDKEVAEGLPVTIIWDILRDAKGYMWLAHGREGFTRFNPNNRKFEKFSYVAGQPGSPAYEPTKFIFEDRIGDIWIGHYPGGVSFHDRSSAAIRVFRHAPDNSETLGNSNVLGLMAGREGVLWAAVGDGVDRIDSKTWRFKHYHRDLGNYPAFGTLSGYVDKENGTWVGTWTEGYSRYDETQDRFLSMPVSAKKATELTPPGAELEDATVWSFCETRDGAFWIGTHNAGISRRDPLTGMFTKYLNIPGDAHSLPHNLVWTCLEDSKGRFWIGTAGGATQMNRETGRFKNYRPAPGAANQLQSEAVAAIHEDAAGRIWFGTDSGLYLYRETTDDFRIFNKHDGLPNAGIKAITRDAQGDLWLGTNSGIARFNPETYAVKNFFAHSSVPFSGINYGAALTTGKGEVLFGSADGLIVIDVGALSLNTAPPPVVLTDFKIFTKSVPIDGADGLLSRAIGRSSEVTLDHSKTMFSFDFAALNYREPEKNQYAYKLEGFDREWREIGSQHQAQYTNLGAGDYRFRVRASNNDGVWNEAGASIRIHMLPPPWKTWWAYAFYVSLALGLILYFVASQKSKRQRIAEQNRLLEAKVAERTEALAQKNKDIQAMLGNMRQGLFAIDEYGTIHHEYSAHLESIFEKPHLAGVEATKLLFGHCNLTPDVINQTEVSLATMIGMDLLNYELNVHLLVNEYEAIVNGRAKILSVDWSPIVENDTVVKLMVSVRDITELKVLERESKIKQRELLIIGQLLKLSDQSYRGFHESAKQCLTRNFLLFAEDAAVTHADIATLFSNMHTLKGNSRTQGFTFIAEAAHNAENYYAEIKSAKANPDKAKLIADLMAVHEVVEEYEAIYKNVGRNAAATEKGEGVWVLKPTLEFIRESFNRQSLRDTAQIAQAKAMLNNYLAKPLADVLHDDLRALERNALELHKLAPEVAIVDSGILIKEAYHGLVRDTLAHLLRNAIDHGIENPSERIACGKPDIGQIKIELFEESHALVVRVGDDGRGIDLNGLYDKAVGHQLLPAGEKLGIAQLANCVFADGISTKSDTSPISGRGMGLCAVKQTVSSAGGDIQLEIADVQREFKPDSGVQRMVFAVRIALPKNMFILENS